MKIGKKLLSAALAVSMLATAAVNASAAAEKKSGMSYKFNAWSYNQVTGNTPWNAEQDYMRVITNGGYNGTSGLEVNIGSPIEANRYLMMTNTLSSKMASGSTYRVKLRYKGAGNFALVFNWGNRANASSYKVESTDGDWKYVYKDITRTADATWVGILCDNVQNNVIDDISIQLLTDTNDDGTPDTPDGVELVTDPGFSNYKTSYTFDVSDEAGKFTTNSWNYDNVGLKDTEGGKIQISKKYAHSGDYSMYIKGETADGYMTVQPKTRASIALGNSYYIEFYAMSVNNSAEVTSGWNRFGTISGWTKSAPDENGWIKYSKTVTLAADSKYGADSLWFLIDRAESILVDDVSVQLVVDGKPSGNNLIADGGFEDTIVNLAEKEYDLSVWKKHYHDSDSNVITADTWNYTYFAEPTKKEAYDGDYSLHMVHPTAVEANQYILVRQEGLNLPAGDYYMSMYVKGKSSTTDICMSTSGAMSGNRKRPNGTFNDWTKKEFIITETTDRNGLDIIAMGAVDLYIDKIEIYSAEAADSSAAISLTNYKTTGENLLKEGSFENSKLKLYSNLVAYPTIAGKSVNISWNNPESYYIDDIKLYVNGNLTRNTVIDTSYGAFNQMFVGGLSNYKTYPVELVITINGVEYKYTTTVTPDDKGSAISFDKWRSLRTETKSGSYNVYPNFVVSDEKEDNGNTVMRINTNIPKVTPNVYANLISKELTLRVDTEYVLKFKYKAENVFSFSVRQDCDINDSIINNKQPVITTNTTTDGWIEKEILLKPEGVYDDEDMDDTTYTSAFLFLVEDATGSVWLDDVELYEIDYLGNLGTTNLISGGDFEFADYTIGEAEYNLIADDGKATPITSLQAGNIEVTAKIKNNAMGDEFKAAVIVALYNGTKLEKFSIAEKTVSESSVSLPADEFTASINVPSQEDNNYKLKVMYWNGTDSLDPLTGIDTLEAIVAE